MHTVSSAVALAAFALMCSAACEEQPAPAPSGVCAGATEQATAGGLLELPRGDVESVVDGDVRAWLDDEVLAVRAPADPGQHELEVVCPTGRATVRLDVETPRFSPVAQWSPEEDPGTPGGREYFATWMGVDDDRGIYVYGGFVFEPQQFTPNHDLFRFDLLTEAWQSVPVSSTSGELPFPGGRIARGAGDDASSVYYLGGGFLRGNDTLVTPPTFMRVTRPAGAVTFSPVEATGTPGSYTGALVLDERRGRFLSVCGFDGHRLGVHCEVQSIPIQGGAWETLSVDSENALPPGRFGFHYMFDVENDRIIVYGGQTEESPDDEVWSLELQTDPPRWVPLERGLRRRNGAWAEDVVNRRLIVWGGTANGVTALPGIDVFTLDRGRETWLHLELEGEDAAGPLPRASGQCVLDDAERRILCGWGNSREGAFTDLWALSL